MVGKIIHETITRLKEQVNGEYEMKLKYSQPWFVENSKIPVWLSYIAPIDIGAITLGPIVISRGEMSEQTRRHETIHWQQYIELGIIGFPILYILFWLIALYKYCDSALAYRMIPFEQEAYDNDEDYVYLLNRKRYAWWGYKI